MYTAHMNKLAVLSVLAVLASAAAAGHTGHGDHGPTGAAVEAPEDLNTGLFTPDSALYGLDRAVDNAGMAIGLKSPEAVAQERANEAQAMAAEGKWDEAERAAQGIESAAANADNESVDGITNAVSTLETVMEQAPEEAQHGLQTAMENVKRAGPPMDVGPAGPGGPGDDADAPSENNDTPAPDEPQPDDPQPDDTNDTDDAEDQGQNQVVVTMEDLAFAPSTIEAAPGQEITFANSDSVSHTVTIPDADIDEELAPGERYTVTFDETGEYALDCTFHGGMDGTITVEE